MHLLQQKLWKFKVKGASLTRKESFRALELGLKYLDARRIPGEIFEFGTLFGDIPLHADYLFSKNKRGFSRRPISVFDSFSGLPGEILESESKVFEEGDLAFPLNAYLQRMSKYGVNEDDIRIFPGYFQESLERYTEDTSCALAWLDADLYSSTQSILKFLESRLVDQSLLFIDDYWVAKNGHGGPSLALEEWTARNREDCKFKLLPWRSFHWAGEIFVFHRVNS